MITRRSFLRTTGSVGSLSLLPGQEVLQPKHKTIDFEQPLGIFGKRKEKDLFLDLAQKTLELYNGSVQSLHEDIQFCKLIVAQKEKNKDVFSKEGYYSGCKNILYSTFLFLVSGDCDAEIVVTPKGLKEPIEDFTHNLDSTGTEQFSIVPVKNTLQIYFKKDPFTNLLIIRSKVLFYYGQNSKWDLFLDLQCTTQLKGNECFLLLFCSPLFYQEDGTEVDPISHLPVKDRKKIKADFIEVLKEKFSKNPVTLEIPKPNAINLVIHIKKVIILDALRFLSNSKNVRQRYQYVDDPLAKGSFNQYNIGLCLSKTYTQQVLTQLIRKQIHFNYPGASYGIALNDIVPINNQMVDLIVHIGIHIDLYDWWVDTARADASMDPIYRLQITDYFSWATFTAFVREQYIIHGSVSGFPPFTDTDAALNEFMNTVKDIMSDYNRISFSIPPSDRTSAMFIGSSLTLLKS